MPTLPRLPHEWVDPLIDTANRRFFFLTTASRPFGMVNLSPDTRVGEDAWKSGYRYQDSYIHWFSHVHAWQLCAVPVMPTVGELKGAQGSGVYKSRFSHETEVAQPGYHAVTLDDYAIHAELTASVRVGFHRYTFGGMQPVKSTGLQSVRPTSRDCHPAWVIFDLGAPIILPMSDAFVRQLDSRTLAGFVENDRTVRRPKRTKIFFYATFDRDIEELVAWQNGDRVPIRQGALAGPGIGAAARFDVPTACPERSVGFERSNVRTLQLKVALSYTSIDAARQNMAAELPHWDFDRARQEAQADWDDHLGRIEVEGGADAQKTKFYTDLFHALKGRRRVSDAAGTYLDNTGDLPRVRQIPLRADGTPQYDHYNSDAFWGAPWSLNLLWAMAWPEITSGFCNTLVDMYKNGGLIPRGPTGGNYSFVMSGPSSTTFLVSAYMQGIRTFDVEAAYAGMLKNHGPGGMMSKAGYEHYTCQGGGVEYYLERGYVPLGIEADAFHMGAAGTRTLENAYHDWALAQLATALGRDDDYAMLMARATNYRHLWDAETRFFRPRLMDGGFLPDIDPMDPLGWEEANGHQNRWYVPHNAADLIALMGGREAFIAELNALFEEAEKTNFIAPHGSHHVAPLDYGNQPSMYIAHLFTYAGAPWLTQKWVRRVMMAAKSDITPYDGYGGDEDQGQMGSLNALMAIGLFNVGGGCQREPFYELTSPIFDRITIHLHPAYHHGGTFVIETEGNGPGERYIQSATLNGEPLDKPWIHHADFIAGGTLHLVLGPEPNRAWGSRPADAPPSSEDTPV
ncbi:MAG: GH92 family glycosyl hydrolase [Anaerolineae bacterium]|nr:GH92 family glycosyl hydrolase [Anaerolineae bacterium]